MLVFLLSFDSDYYLNPVLFSALSVQLFIAVLASSLYSPLVTMVIMDFRTFSLLCRLLKETKLTMLSIVIHDLGFVRKFGVY